MRRFYSLLCIGEGMICDPTRIGINGMRTRSLRQRSHTESADVRISFCGYDRLQPLESCVCGADRDLLRRRSARRHGAEYASCPWVRTGGRHHWKCARPGAPHLVLSVDPTGTLVSRVLSSAINHGRSRLDRLVRRACLNKRERARRSTRGTTRSYFVDRAFRTRVELRALL